MPATAKSLFTKIANLARMTKLGLKGEDRQSNKDYEGPRQAVNLANLAKVIRFFACNGKELVHKNRKYSKNNKVNKGEDRKSNKD